MQTRAILKYGKVLLCTSAFLPLAVHAQTIRSGVEVSASAQATSNPYLDSNSGDYVGAGSIEIRPWVAKRTETDEIDLSGFVNLRGFTSRYDVESSYGGSVRATSRLNNRTSAYGTMDIVSSSARSSLQSFGRLPGVADPIAPENPIPTFPIGDDLALIRLPGRTTSVSILAGADRVLDARSSAGGNIAYQKVSTGDSRGLGYDSISLGANYSMQWSTRTTIGLGASISRSRYEGPSPESTIMGGRVSIKHQAGEFWNLSASAGLSGSRTDSSIYGPSDTALAVVGDVSACYRRDTQSFCANAGRSQQPSVLGGARALTNVGFLLNQRLSARNRVDASVGYSFSDEDPTFPGSTRSVEILSLRTTFTRSLNPRLDGYIFASGSRVYDDGATPVNDLATGSSVAFGAGIRVRLGSLR